MDQRHIESHPDILAGEPVLRGTRIAARLIAGFVHEGASREEIAAEYDISLEQIEAAVLFDQRTPEDSHPLIRKRRTAHVSSA